LTIGLCSLNLNASGNDIIIKTQSDHGIVIEFTPRQWKISSKVIDGKSYYRIDFENCVFKTFKGQPLIPQRMVVVGIPFGAGVSYELVEIERVKTIHGKPIPVPSFGRDSMAEFQYQEDPVIYQEQQAFPSQLVKISQPAIIRDQQVVMISLFPLQFFPQREQIQLYGRMVVRINFIGGQSEQKFERKLDHDFLNHQLLINPGQAANWRKPTTAATQPDLKRTNLAEYYKIWIREEGIYKITGEDLKKAGVYLKDIKPYQIKIFNNGGFQLPQSIDEQRPDSLIENAIFVSDGGDGSFDPQDYVLFYGKSVNGWKYDNSEKFFFHYINPYTRENLYWLCWQHPDSGKRMVRKTIIPAMPVTEVTSYYDHICVENEYKNLLNSGTNWFGKYFSSATPARSYQFDLTGVLQDREAMVKINLAGISPGEHQFSLFLNDSYIARVPTFYGSSGEYTAIKLKEFTTTITYGLKDGYNRITVKYMPTSDISLAYMNWIELSVQRQLSARDDQLLFYSPDSIGFYNYYLQSFSSDDIYVFDITNFHNVILPDISRTEMGAVEFIDSTNSELPKKYLAITTEQYRSPTKIEKDIPSNWHNINNTADFIIITYDDFYDAALALKSLRENCDSLKTAVVKISDIYDEFSWGLVDPAAIRDFVKYAYDSWQKQPRYVLLFGDGDYDYKNIISPHDPNWIPPFETSDLDEISSRARDDWYVCVAGNDNLLDLAIGRIPVRNPDEALAVVKKIIDYEISPAIGEWCHTITMVADDEYGQGGRYDAIDHIPDAETIAEHLIPKNYCVNKIYLTEYPIVNDASISGIRRPGAQQALIKQINQGSLIINFIGHGHAKLWTHEHILVISDDLPRMNNGPRQAFWIAATCDFGRFDNPDFQSFAEQLVTVAERGAIAVFSSCRLAYPDENVSLNRAVYRFLFNQSGTGVRLGDVIMYAKNSVGNYKNDQLYHLLGDPTLRLAMPSCLVQITNHTPDSMRALSRMEVEGKIHSIREPLAEFQGKLLFKAFDSRIQRIYSVNQWKEWSYILPGNTIFRGEATVVDGQFKSQFIIPKDISYGGRDGRFSVFYWQDVFFGTGNLDSIFIGGTQTDFDDPEGPGITIGFEGQNFMSGGFVPPNPVLKVTISDSLSGVNIAGDIGHKITMILDNVQDEKIELNDYFHYDRDSYLVGHISYPLTDLSEGSHQILVKAWDNCNNSSQSEAEFTVVSLDKLIIQDIFNYPNPFSNSTEFTFWVSQDCDIQIKIYTLSGKLICKISDLKAELGFNHFRWGGFDHDGDPLANGVYLYKVCASRFNGTRKIQVEQIEKCVIMR